jgi:transposase, IS6 family
MSFGSFNSARRTIQGYEGMNMIRKGQIKGVEKGDVLGQISFIKEIFGLAA